jgi:hypothetical protein
MIQFLKLTTNEHIDNNQLAQYNDYLLNKLGFPKCVKLVSSNEEEDIFFNEYVESSFSDKIYRTNIIPKLKLGKNINPIDGLTDYYHGFMDLKEFYYRPSMCNVKSCHDDFDSNRRGAQLSYLGNPFWFGMYVGLPSKNGTDLAGGRGYNSNLDTYCDLKPYKDINILTTFNALLMFDVNTAPYICLSRKYGDRDVDTSLIFNMIKKAFPDYGIAVINSESPSYWTEEENWLASNKYTLKTSRVDAMKLYSAPIVTSVGNSEYPLYRYPDIASRESRQVRLLNGVGARLEREVHNCKILLHPQTSFPRMEREVLINDLSIVAENLGYQVGSGSYTNNGTYVSIRQLPCHIDRPVTCMISGEQYPISSMTPFKDGYIHNSRILDYVYVNGDFRTTPTILHAELDELGNLILLDKFDEDGVRTKRLTCTVTLTHTNFRKLINCGMSDIIKSSNRADNDTKIAVRIDFSKYLATLGNVNDIKYYTVDYVNPLGSSSYEVWMYQASTINTHVINPNYTSTTKYYLMGEEHNREICIINTIESEERDIEYSIQDTEGRKLMRLLQAGKLIEVQNDVLKNIISRVRREYFTTLIVENKFYSDNLDLSDLVEVI